MIIGAENSFGCRKGQRSAISIFPRIVSVTLMSRSAEQTSYKHFSP